MNYNIAICDDDINQIEYLKPIITTWAKDNRHPITVSAFPSAEAFLFAHEEQNDVDILLLDIEMKEMNGVELAKKLRAENDRLQIIFVTGYDKYIADGYDVAALHYLIKPVRPEKLCEVLTRAARLLSDMESCLVFSSNHSSIKLPLNKIVYIESELNYICIHTADVSYKTRMTLSEIEKKLDDGFFRTGKSFIVGLRFVKSISHGLITLDDGTEIPLSRNLYDAANKAFINFF